jgi:hypothetical protein
MWHWRDEGRKVRNHISDRDIVGEFLNHIADPQSFCTKDIKVLVERSPDLLQ